MIGQCKGMFDKSVHSNIGEFLSCIQRVSQLHLPLDLSLDTVLRVNWLCPLEVVSLLSTNSSLFRNLLVSSSLQLVLSSNPLLWLNKEG